MDRVYQISSFIRFSICYKRGCLKLCIYQKKAPAHLRRVVILKDDTRQGLP